MSFKPFCCAGCERSDSSKPSLDPALAVREAGGFAALRRTSTFRLQALNTSVASLSATWRSAASMIQKSARYFSVPTWVGLDGWDRSVVWCVA
jgi:hypothetical protein